MSTVDARAEKSLDLINRGLERKKILSVRVEGKKKLKMFLDCFFVGIYLSITSFKQVIQFYFHKKARVTRRSQQKKV